MSHPAAITNQPFPFNLTQKRNRRSRLPKFHRTNPYTGGFHANPA